MKKHFNIIALFVTAIAFAACTNTTATGDPAEVLSKKAYSEVVKKYDHFVDFSEGLCKVGIGDWDVKWGFVDTKGKEVIACTWDCVGDCHDGMMWFKENDKYGFINRKGEVVIPASYEKVENFSDGLALIKVPAKDAEYSWDVVYGFINKKGEIVIPTIYDRAESFSEGLAMVKKDKKVGYLDTKGEYAITANYDDGTSFSEGIAFVEKANRVNAINKKDEVVFTLPKDIVPYGVFHDGLVCVKQYGEDDDYYGYMNTKGEIAIPCKYDDADDFEDGIAQVEANDHDFYINTKGEKVEKP